MSMQMLGEFAQSFLSNVYACALVAPNSLLFIIILSLLLFIGKEGVLAAARWFNRRPLGVGAIIDVYKEG